MRAEITPKGLDKGIILVMADQNQTIPIYTSRGDCEAYLVYPYIYNKQGEWIGWISPNRKVFSVFGHYVGWLAEGPRILRKIADGYMLPKRYIPHPPELRIAPLANVPLAPMMSELTFSTIDVLLDQPELLPALDFGEMREDMD